MSKKEILRLLEPLNDDDRLCIMTWKHDGPHYELFHESLQPMRKAPKPYTYLDIDGKIHSVDLFVLGIRDDCIAHDGGRYFEEMKV